MKAVHCLCMHQKTLPSWSIHFLTTLWNNIACNVRSRYLVCQNSCLQTVLGSTSNMYCLSWQLQKHYWWDLRLHELNAIGPSLRALDQVQMSFQRKSDHLQFLGALVTASTDGQRMKQTCIEKDLLLKLYNTYVRWYITEQILIYHIWHHRPRLHYEYYSSKLLSILR